MPALLLATLFAPRGAVAQAAPLTGLDAYVQAAMKDWEVPGLALAVVRGDSVIYVRGYGVADLATGAPVDENTLFAIASTSKAFTVAALAMLVDDGKVRWDDPVAKYLPEFELKDPWVTGHLTVRDLLTHRVGVAREDNLWLSAPFSRDEILRRARYLDQVDEFRARYGYNNLMFIAAGEVAGRASGKGWDDFVAERIFQPLGMTRSTTRAAAVETRGNVAASHTRVGGKVTSVSRRNYDNIGGAGAVFSSAHDMGQWVRLHAGGGAVAGTRLLSDSVVKEMRQPHNPLRVDSVAHRLFPDTKFRAYALGWNVQDFRGRTLVHHSGSINYTRTHVGFIPEEGIGFVAMANLTTSDLQMALMYRVLDALLGVPPTDWSAEYLTLAHRGDERSARSARELEAARLQGTIPSVALEQYAGTYESVLYGEARVTVEGGKLVLAYAPNYVADLEHWHHDTFRGVWRRPDFGRDFVTFSLDERARITALELDGFGTFRRAAQPEGGR
ncbi:MAG: serine hydrolase [Longimicrobiales bacterium]|nr:serine hydrolase [Longimicrobiales bacterium]